jgi:hypothetical protein
MHAHQQFQSADPADEDEHHGGGVIAPGHKNVDLTTSSIRDNQWINFLLTHNCSSTTYYASNAVLTAVLDSNLEYMGLIGSIHTTGANYDTATRKVAFTFRAPPCRLAPQARFSSRPSLSPPVRETRRPKTSRIFESAIPKQLNPTRWRLPASIKSV